MRVVGNDAAAVRETAAWASLVLLAVPWSAIGSVVAAAGTALDGKTLVDVTNALGPDMALAVGGSSHCGCPITWKPPERTTATPSRQLDERR